MSHTNIFVHTKACRPCESTPVEDGAADTDAQCRHASGGVRLAVGERLANENLCEKVVTIERVFTNHGNRQSKRGNDQFVVVDCLLTPIGRRE